jgi:superfamily II DNA or RNA helicase
MIKTMNELFDRITSRETVESMLTGLKPAERGHIGEGLLRLLTLLGIHPTDALQSVIPYTTELDERRFVSNAELTDRLNIIKYGKVNAGASGKTDVAWREKDVIATCTSKFGCGEIKAIDKLEVDKMLVQFTESGGYTENGHPVLRKNIKPYVLVYDRSQLETKAKHARASSQVTKDNLDNILDLSDLTRMCAVLNDRLKGCISKDMEEMVNYLLSDEKGTIQCRFHQLLLKNKIEQQISQGAPVILLGALPRSGKTYIGAAVAKKYEKILTITTRPSETRRQWNNVFKNHREFSNHRVLDVNPENAGIIAELNQAGEKLVAIASIQFLKGDETNAAHLSMIGLEWDIVLIDEVHQGGTTDLSNETLNKYIGSAIRIMMTATYTKPVICFAIPAKNCIYWDLEDVRIMPRWGEAEVFQRLCEKYGTAEVSQARREIYESGATELSVRSGYILAPQLKMMTTLMQSDKYQELCNLTNSTDNIYGFSMRSLFMTNKDSPVFQNQQAVDRFLALFSGSDKTIDYPKGDMSMLARIKRYFKTINHRNSDEFVSMLWFVPSGQGQLLENVKPAMISRIKANKILANFATMTLDSGMRDISKAVADAVSQAKAQGKHGLIVLTGDVGSLGVSLPEVDVAVMLHDIESADMIYQQMLRCLTEDKDKKCGIVIDYNVWRTLTTLNTYATSRCGQSDKSSSDRINWCISHLVDIDPDLWECPYSPLSVSRESILDTLTKEWRKMLEKTGTSLHRLAAKYVDLGEDQKELDRVARFLTEGGCLPDKTSISSNPDQEKLDAGIEYRKENSQEENTIEEEEPLPTPESEVVKSVNINDVLARLIPELALLSGCKLDLLEAMESIRNQPTVCAALNGFLTSLYELAAELNPFDVITKIIKNNYIKLKDAREIYEYITYRILMLIDNRPELIAFLGQHLKPKELEKKQNGEVFTPPELIEQKFDKLTIACPTIWSDPSMKFLDPANGIGNYPAIAFHRLMEGLKEVIPNEADRKKHILENQIYMCELNPKNIEVSRKIFDPDNIYALNLYQGSYLDLDPKKEWGVEKFDVVFGNPPYQPPSNGKKGGKSLWPTFVEKSIKLLKVNGFLVFVHPALWRKPENELHDLMFGKQFHYLSIHSKQEGEKVFHATTRYDWYVLQNTSPTLPASIRFDDGISSSLMITPSLPFIVNHGGDVMEKMRNKSQFGFLNTEMTCEGHTQRDYIKKIKNTTHAFPVVNSSSKVRGINLAWSSKALKHQYTQKVIFSNGEVIQPFYDSGKFGTTQGGIYIPVSSEEEGQKVVRYLKSKLVYYIIAATKWSNFETNKQIFWSIPHPKDLPDNFTDEEVYAYFGLTPEEISRIEANQRRSGLTDYVALEAPVVSVPAPLVEAVATTIKKMKLTVLKKLCKDQNIVLPAKSLKK